MELLEKHFDLAFTAPNGVQKLRELILTFAMQGKLVLQDPKDEPVEVLLKQNQELIAKATEGIRKTIPELRTTEAKIPLGWARCQLADVALVVMGNSPPGNTYNDHGEGVPLINGPVEFSRGAFGLTLKTKYTTAPSRLCQKSDLLVCVRGATTGRTNIAAFDACIGRGVGLVRGWEAQQYLNYLLWHLGQQLLEQGKGTTFPSIAYADLAGLEIWLPPLAEQRRIVAKIDRLMAQCDELENLGGDRNQKRITIHTAALNRLLTSNESSDFSTAWRFITQHFGELYSVKENVAELRKAILQLAVMGKLVPQDPNDEPAKYLLSKISASRRNNFSKKTPSTNNLDESSKPNTKLPESWELCQLWQIATVCLGGTPSRKESSFWNGTIPWVSSGEVANCRIKDTEEYITSDGLKNSNAKVYPHNTVLIAMIGQGKTRGQSAILDIEACTNQNVAGLVFDSENVEPNYVWKWALSEYEKTRSGSRGGAQPALNGKKISNLWISIPPLNEQRRIVAKIDQLMALCDCLEQQIDAATSKQTTLLNAVMAQV